MENPQKTIPTKESITSNNPESSNKVQTPSSSLTPFNCPICLTPIIKSKLSILSCNHNICIDCLLKFIEIDNKCPVCNQLFFSYTTKIDNLIHKLSEENLSNINNKKKEFGLDENFDCITISDIKIQLTFIKSHVDCLFNKLFGPRGEKGSEKENEVLNEIYNMIEDIKKVIKEGEGGEKENTDEEIVDFKEINSKIDEMIKEIKKIEKREYKNYIEMLPENECNNFEIEYCTKKKGKKKKHK